MDKSERKSRRWKTKINKNKNEGFSEGTVQHDNLAQANIPSSHRLIVFRDECSIHIGGSFGWLLVIDHSTGIWHFHWDAMLVWCWLLLLLLVVVVVVL
jgi:hypothetical protein